VSVLWVLPLVVLAAGAVIVATRLRTTTQATIELQQECLKLEELRAALDDVRQEADLTRESLDRIRHR
jgi:cytochrome c-type biogenesis protein CcmH/NrfF